jgi:hypothetical protein
MAVQPRVDRRFDRSSPVGRYWLAQCEGFRVEGPLKGRVEQVVGSVDSQSAEALVVRTAWGRRDVPVAAVDAVVPAARLIVVDGGAASSREDSRAQAAVDTSRRAIGSLAATAASKGPPIGRLVADAAVGLALFVAAGLVTLARSLRVVAARTALLAAAAAGAGARRVSDLRARRRSARVNRPAVRAHEGRKMSRAAVLGLDRNDHRRPELPHGAKRRRR